MQYFIGYSGFSDEEPFGRKNPIEEKFGPAKTAYGMNRIKASLPDTSKS
ncbi:MAG: hypothetical protein R6U46_13720 [Marinilabilia sp.]